MQRLCGGMANLATDIGQEENGMGMETIRTLRLD